MRGCTPSHACHDGGSNPMVPVNTSSQEWTVRVALQLLNKPRRHLRVSGEHGQTVCPTCPIRRDTCPGGAPGPLRPTPTAESHNILVRGVDVQEGAHASPKRRHRRASPHAADNSPWLRRNARISQADCRSVTMGIVPAMCVVRPPSYPDALG